MRSPSSARSGILARLEGGVHGLFVDDRAAAALTCGLTVGDLLEGACAGAVGGVCRGRGRRAGGRLGRCCRGEEPGTAAGVGVGGEGAGRVYAQGGSGRAVLPHRCNRANPALFVSIDDSIADGSRDLSAGELPTRSASRFDKVRVRTTRAEGAAAEARSESARPLAPMRDRKSLVGLVQSMTSCLDIGQIPSP